MCALGAKRHALSANKYWILSPQWHHHFFAFVWCTNTQTHRTTNIIVKIKDDDDAAKDGCPAVCADDAAAEKENLVCRARRVSAIEIDHLFVRAVRFISFYIPIMITCHQSFISFFSIEIAFPQVLTNPRKSGLAELLFQNSNRAHWFSFIWPRVLVLDLD